MDLKKRNLKTSIATMIQLWMRVFSMFISGIETGNVPYELEVDVLDAIAGETFLVKTWADNRQLKSITVSRDNAIRFTAFFLKTDLKISRDLQGVIFLENNNVTREMSLILENFNKVDEGKYNVEEIAAATIRNPFERKYGNWNFTLNVIDPKETKKCSVGESIEIKFRISSIQSHLYYYDKRVASLFGSDCNVLTNSHLYGRVRCSIDNDRHTIIIENVTQRDTGLYKVNNNDIERIYLNVTDQTTNVTIGENVTIDWFYSQQAINRTLRIIHSNNGIIMNLPPSNEPQIVPAFREHLLYSGEISRCYMSLTVLNIRKLDSGVYKIETLHGSTISGCKHLFVEGYAQTANEMTESTPDLTEHSSSTRGLSLVPSSEILDKEEYTSLSLTVQLTSGNPIITYDNTNTASRENSQTLETKSILIDVKYVVIGALGLIMLMIGFLIWIQRRNTYRMKAVQQLVLETSSSTLYAAPSAIRNQLPTSIVDEEGFGRLIHSTQAGNAQNMLRYLANPDNSLSFDRQSSCNISVPILEDDKPGLIRKSIVTSKESNRMSMEKLSEACDNDMHGLLEDCPTVCMLDSAAGYTVVGLSQLDQFSHDLYAKVKKGSRSSSTNNTSDQFAFTSVTDGDCTDGYKMVKFTRRNDPRNTLQDVKFISESTNPVNVSLQEEDNTKTNYVRDTMEDDGYETCGNMKHMTYMEQVKVSEDEGTVTVKDQEPKKCMIPRGAMHSDYADIGI